MNRQTYHSRAPWKAGTLSGRAPFTIFSNGAVDSVIVCEVTPDPEEGEANARLIAAAPDLLAALKAALNALETSELDDWATFNDLAIAAIKKAQAQGERR